MNANKFFIKIRQIIREEIALALENAPNNEVHKKLKNEGVFDQKKEIKAEIEKRPLKKNPSLQDLLNETADSMRNDTLTFTSKDAAGFDRTTMAEMLGYSDMPKRGSITVPPVDINGVPVQHIDPAVKTALTRDYSDVMKAIKSKKNNAK